MTLQQHIIGPTWVLEVSLTTDSHTIAAWRCPSGGRAERAEYDPAVVARSVAVVTVTGHGSVSKAADSQVAARVAADSATFLATQSAGQLAFVRHERLEPLHRELAAAGIHPQAVFVALAPDAAAARWREGFRWRQPGRLTDEGSALAQALARRAALPVLGLFFGLLAINALYAPSLGRRRQLLQTEIMAHERTASSTADASARQRALLEEFSARPSVSRAVLCDRIAAAVPEGIVLTRLAVEPLAKRFEAEKPLLRQEHTAELCGTTAAAGDVSLLVERLAAEACCRAVHLTHVKRERDNEKLVFRITIEL